MLAVAHATIKEAVQAIEECLAVSRCDQALLAMPIEQTELLSQLLALEVSRKTVADAVTQQTMLLQQVLEKVRQKSTKQQKCCFKCEASHCFQSGKQRSATTKATTARNGEGPARA